MANFPMLGSLDTGSTFFDIPSESFIFPDDEFHARSDNLKMYGRGINKIRREKHKKPEFNFNFLDEYKGSDSPRALRSLRYNIFQHVDDFGNLLDHSKLSKHNKFYNDDMLDISPSDFEDLQVFFSTTLEFELTNNAFYMDWPFFFNFYRLRD